MNKKLKIRLFVVFALLALGLAACDPSPSQNIVAGESLLNETFDSPDAWENYEFEGTSLSVSNGAYQIASTGEGFSWGLNDVEHTDVVIEVTAVQNSISENNAYGVMCRADTSNNGDGYYFLVSGDGFYSISKGEGDNVNPLIDWTAHSSVNKGQATNTIKAICNGSYLALHINGQFVAEIEDASYASGYTGLSAAAFDGGDVDISFDDLTISAASVSAE